MKKIKVGVLGATGMVGQRFITLLDNHPWFEVVVVAASPQSAGKTYENAVAGRWHMSCAIPEKCKKIKVLSVENDMHLITKNVDMVFSALDLDKEKIKQIEIAYAQKDVAVVSNNSAHRATVDVPMIIPEINGHHTKLIDIQKKNRGWKKGLIAVKPNCSIQSYVMILTALKKFQPSKVSVTSLQSISGAGKTFDSWPQMIDNVIPYIGGEEEKSEKEPLKIWGEIERGKLKLAGKPLITATCIRVPTSDGHMACVSVSFKNNPNKNQIIKSVTNFNPLKELELPSSPKQLINYCHEIDRPQSRIDRDWENGMGISMGRLAEDTFFDWKFIALSHNTVRGAAGGAILLAELLYKKDYFN